MNAHNTKSLRTRAVLSLLAATTVAMATPALAQNYGQGPGRNIDQRQAQLEQRIERMAHNGRINRNEHRLFQRQFDHVDRLQWSYGRNGYSRGERAELNAQLDRIQSQIRYERREGRNNRW